MITYRKDFFSYSQVHFDADQWEDNKFGQKVKLKKTAVPTQFSYATAQSKETAPPERLEIHKKTKNKWGK